MKKKSIVVPLIFIITLLSLSSFLKEPAVEKFQVDTKASVLTWKGKKVTGEHTGNVQIVSGALSTEGKVISKGNFEIDLSSITVTDIQDKTSNEKLVNHLKGDDFFGVEKFPKANFILSSVTPKSNNEYLVNGKLTIKGITNDVQFPASIVREGKKITATAKIVIDRTKYNIRYRSTNFFDSLGDKAIADDFELDLKLVANAQPGV